MVGQEVLDMLRELTEEGQRNGGDDEPDRLRRLAVQGPGDLIGAVVELRDRLGHPLPCLLGEVAAVVEHAGDCSQRDACSLGNICQCGFAV